MTCGIDARVAAEPSLYPDRVTKHWNSRRGAARFELAFPQAEATLTSDDRVFMAALRERAANWGGAPRDTFSDTWEDDDDRTGVIGCLDLAVVGQDLFGAAYTQGHLHCGPVHPDLTHFWQPWSPGLECDGHGSPEALAHEAADWLEALLHRPVVLWLWSVERSGSAPAFYAGRYEFPDGGDLIAEWFDPQCAPAVESSRAREGGHFVEHWDKSVLTTETLTCPDSFFFVRGDRSAARIPEGCHELHDGHAARPPADARVLACDLRWDTRRAHELGLRRRGSS